MRHMPGTVKGTKIQLHGLKSSIPGERDMKISVSFSLIFCNRCCVKIARVGGARGGMEGYAMD
jgi:hypothetical protein